MRKPRPIPPNPLFSFWRADEAAECLEVSAELYKALWTKIVPLQGEVTANDGSWCLKKYWSKLTIREQIELNIAAVKHQKEVERL